MDINFTRQTFSLETKVLKIVTVHCNISFKGSAVTAETSTGRRRIYLLINVQWDPGVLVVRGRHWRGGGQRTVWGHAGHQTGLPWLDQVIPGLTGIVGVSSERSGGDEGLLEWHHIEAQISTKLDLPVWSAEAGLEEQDWGSWMESFHNVFVVVSLFLSPPSVFLGELVRVCPVWCWEPGCTCDRGRPRTVAPPSSPRRTPGRPDWLPRSSVSSWPSSWGGWWVCLSCPPPSGSSSGGRRPWCRPEWLQWRAHWRPAAAELCAPVWRPP